VDVVFRRVGDAHGPVDQQRDGAQVRLGCGADEGCQWLLPLVIAMSDSEEAIHAPRRTLWIAASLRSSQ
jgi:hypothetical protein